ncbi:MAG TPA: NUDIX hydrolase [Acidimicrobiales bacterium]|nr:NUDIX hydrolase [Acidimicrobiales bacterium]
MARLSKHDASDVRAAGGVVLRPGPSGDPEVLLVHRPKYDDWTIPKGKLDPGESDLDAAVREVEEETGLHCHVGRELPSVAYDDRNGHSKVVRYWEMTPARGRFKPNHEVDEARWLPLEEASQLLTHDRDRDVLAAVAD